MKTKSGDRTPFIEDVSGDPNDVQTVVLIAPEAHRLWAKLTIAKPRASAVLHQLVRMMDRKNVVVISHGRLAEILSCHRVTIGVALKYLSKYGWVQIVKTEKGGTANSYVVNNRVARIGDR